MNIEVHYAETCILNLLKLNSAHASGDVLVVVKQIKYFEILEVVFCFPSYSNELLRNSCIFGNILTKSSVATSMLTFSFFFLQVGWLTNLLTVISQTPVAHPQKSAPALLSSSSVFTLWWIVFAVRRHASLSSTSPSPDWFPVADPVYPCTCRPSLSLDWSTRSTCSGIDRVSLPDPRIKNDDVSACYFGSDCHE